MNPWLPLAPDWRERNVERQLADPGSMLTLYRRVLALRAARPALRTGSFILHPPTGPDVLVYERRLGDDHLLVALNFSAEPRGVQLPGEHGPILLSTEPNVGPGATDARTLTGAGGVVLRGGEGIVVELSAGERRNGTAPMAAIESAGTAGKETR